jgi:hypothetical protein
VLAVVLAEAATGALQIPRRALSSLCGLNQRGHPTVSSSRARVETVSDANVPKSVPKPNENGPRRFLRGPFPLGGGDSDGCELVGERHDSRQTWPIEVVWLALPH